MEARSKDTLSTSLLGAQQPELDFSSTVSKSENSQDIDSLADMAVNAEDQSERQSAASTEKANRKVDKNEKKAKKAKEMAEKQSKLPKHVAVKTVDKIRKPSEIEEITFLPVGLSGRSQIGIWHRPTPKHIANLKLNAAVTMIISLQGPREHVEEIQNNCKLHGIEWVNVPLDGANLPLLQNILTRKMVHEKLRYLDKTLNTTEHKALLHCAAGIHRTGTFTYSLLRILGNSEAQSMELLRQLRQVTFEQVGQHRIDLGEEFFTIPLLKEKESMKKVDPIETNTIQSTENEEQKASD